MKDRIIISFYDSNIDNFLLDNIEKLVPNKRARGNKLKELAFLYINEHPEIIPNLNVTKSEQTITKDDTTGNILADLGI